MPRQHVSVLLAVFAALPAARADAQQPPDSAARRAAAQPQDTSSACRGCPRRRPGTGIGDIAIPRALSIDDVIPSTYLISIGLTFR